MSKWVLPSSFRDPSGYVFTQEGALYRQVNACYQNQYSHLLDSGLYQLLTRQGFLIPHEEVTFQHAIPSDAFRVLKPEQIFFISYPHEWCFSQLKDAALLTLEIQKCALQFGMSLKDASAFNIQFRNGKPILIDSLSFENYDEGKPWVAYKQFCQHFLAPLSLMSRRDPRLNQVFRIYPDGIPLDLATKLLPLRAYRLFSLFIHIYLHSKSERLFATRNSSEIYHAKRFTRQSFLGLVQSLENAIRKLTWIPPKSIWSSYYSDLPSYTKDALGHKKQLVSDWLDHCRPGSAWDLGSNLGIFSRLASKKGIPTISFDMDPACVEQNYLESKGDNDCHILPLLLDLTNPSPAIGWDNRERMSLLDRAPADLAMALGLIHHLSIGNNVPFDRLATFFSRLCKWLIVEFVPLEDPQCRTLLRHRREMFSNYNDNTFESEFGRFFRILLKRRLQESVRTLYLMEVKYSPNDR